MSIDRFNIPEKNKVYSKWRRKKEAERKRKAAEAKDAKENAELEEQIWESYKRSKGPIGEPLIDPRLEERPTGKGSRKALKDAVREYEERQRMWAEKRDESE